MTTRLSALVLPLGILVAPLVGEAQQAGILVAHLASRLTPGTEREELARRIADTADPLPFALDCLRWFRKGDDTA